MIRRTVGSPRVQRFVLQQNIERFEMRMRETDDAEDRQRLELLRSAFERELALLESKEAGVKRAGWAFDAQADEAAEDRAAAIARFREEFDPASGIIAALIDPAPGLVYVEVNPASEQSLGVSRSDLVGAGLFERFPDNPDDPAAQGVYNVYMSLRLAAETAQPHAMPLQRYDVPDAQGVFVERYWKIVNTPLFDDKGRLLLLLNTAEEVTDEARPSGGL